MVIFFAVLLALAYALGFAMLYRGLQEIRLGVGARTWPVAPAQWMDCVLEHRISDRGSRYQVRVAYRYSVDGRDYAGDNIAIGYLASGAREVHTALHERLMKMQPFVVRYCPGRPEVSTILPAENALVYGTLVWSLLWLGFTTVGALAAWAASGQGLQYVVQASGWIDALMGR